MEALALGILIFSVRSFKAGAGALSGRVSSVLAKVVIALIMFVVIILDVFAQDEPGCKIPQELTQLYKLASEEGLLYKGMPKEDLKKAGYFEEKALGYYTYQDLEFMVFSDWTTTDFKDIITFVVEDQKVIDWFKGYKEDILGEE